MSLSFAELRVLCRESGVHIHRSHKAVHVRSNLCSNKGVTLPSVLVGFSSSVSLPTHAIQTELGSCDVPTPRAPSTQSKALGQLADEREPPAATQSVKARSPPSTLRILQWNVQSLAARRHLVIHYCAKHALDIVCLQETWHKSSSLPTLPGFALAACSSRAESQRKLEAAVCLDLVVVDEELKQQLHKCRVRWQEMDPKSFAQRVLTHSVLLKALVQLLPEDFPGLKQLMALDAEALTVRLARLKPKHPTPKPGYPWIFVMTPAAGPPGAELFRFWSSLSVQLKDGATLFKVQQHDQRPTPLSKQVSQIAGYSRQERSTSPPKKAKDSDSKKAPTARMTPSLTQGRHPLRF